MSFVEMEVFVNGAAAPRNWNVITLSHARRAVKMFLPTAGRCAWRAMIPCMGARKQ